MLQEPEPEQPAHGRLTTEDDVRVWAELVETKRTGGKSARRAASQQMAEFLTRLAGRGGGATESQLRSELNQAMHTCAAGGIRIPRAAASPAVAPTADPRRRGHRSNNRSTDGGSSDEPCLYTIQHRHKPTSDERVREAEGSQYVLPAGNETQLPRAPIYLGQLDARFAQEGRRPTLVTLLLVFPEVLDQDRLVAAVQAALIEFPAACGRRAGTTITSGPGVRFTATTVELEALHARPPPRCLFDPPSRSDSEDHSGGVPATEVLTVRLATSQGGRQCSLGVCFDHALCDISGVALWLSHVSAHYTEQPSAPLPPRPHHARQEQARIVARCEVQLPDRPDDQGVPARGIPQNASVGGDCQPTPCETVRPVPVMKGGCVCVEWSYTAADLRHLKDVYKAYSRHDACFADVLLLLRGAGAGASTGVGSASSITSVTISRDDRAIADIPTEHFGNGIVLVKASLPQNADASGCEIAAALRSAIRDGQGESGIDTAGGGGVEAAADVHLNTWWHPLQKPMSFGVCTLKDSDDMIEGQAQQPTFAIGPASLAGAGQMCLSRGGQPNVTVLPASSSGGFTAYLLCPLEVGHAVLRQLRERRKSSKKAQQPKQKEQRLAAQKQRATMPGNPMARVVWFHGLGDASASWHRCVLPNRR